MLVSAIILQCLQKPCVVSVLSVSDSSKCASIEIVPHLSPRALTTLKQRHLPKTDLRLDDCGSSCLSGLDPFLLRRAQVDAEIQRFSLKSASNNIKTEDLHLTELGKSQHNPTLHKRQPVLRDRAPEHHDSIAKLTTGREIASRRRLEKKQKGKKSKSFPFSTFF